MLSFNPSPGQNAVVAAFDPCFTGGGVDAHEVEQAVKRALAALRGIAAETGPTLSKLLSVDHSKTSPAVLPFLLDPEVSIRQMQLPPAPTQTHYQEKIRVRPMEHLDLLKAGRERGVATPAAVKAMETLSERRRFRIGESLYHAGAVLFLRGDLDNATVYRANEPRRVRPARLIMGNALVIAEDRNLRELLALIDEARGIRRIVIADQTRLDTGDDAFSNPVPTLYEIGVTPQARRTWIAFLDRGSAAELRDPLGAPMRALLLDLLERRRSLAAAA